MYIFINLFLNIHHAHYTIDLNFVYSFIYLQNCFGVFFVVVVVVFFTIFIVNINLLKITQFILIPKLKTCLT